MAPTIYPRCEFREYKPKHNPNELRNLMATTITDYGLSSLGFSIPQQYTSFSLYNAGTGTSPQAPVSEFYKVGDIVKTHADYDALPEGTVVTRTMSGEPRTKIGERKWYHGPHQSSGQLGSSYSYKIIHLPRTNVRRAGTPDPAVKEAAKEIRGAYFRGEGIPNAVSPNTDLSKGWIEAGKAVDKLLAEALPKSVVDDDGDEWFLTKNRRGYAMHSSGQEGNGTRLAEIVRNYGPIRKFNF